jgi:hypothetical protein
MCFDDHALTHVRVEYMGAEALVAIATAVVIEG